MDRVMIAVSQFGVPLIVAFVVLQWWSKTDRVHMRHAAISAGLAFLLHYATGIGFGKIFFVLNLPFYWLAQQRGGAPGIALVGALLNRATTMVSGWSGKANNAAPGGQP